MIRFEKKHICPCCNIEFSGVGTHMTKKFAQIIAGNTLRLKRSQHDRTPDHQRREIDYKTYYVKLIDEYLDEKKS